MSIRVVVGYREPLGMALRRLRKLVMRTRKRKPGHFIRESEIRRYKEHRKWLKARRETELAKREGRQ